jgi:hypothetical protein
MSRGKPRKFEILSVELIPGGAGPIRSYWVRYRGIVNKQWIEQGLWSSGRTEQEARKKAEQRFGGKK